MHLLKSHVFSSVPVDEHPEPCVCFGVLHSSVIQLVNCLDI